MLATKFKVRSNSSWFEPPRTQRGKGKKLQPVHLAPVNVVALIAARRHVVTTVRRGRETILHVFVFQLEEAGAASKSPQSTLVRLHPAIEQGVLPELVAQLHPYHRSVGRVTELGGIGLVGFVELLPGDDV